jgi:hypothetical protein
MVKPHEAYRAALEHVLDDPPSNGPTYLAALRTLGANAKLVAECVAVRRLLISQAMLRDPQPAV